MARLSPLLLLLLMPALAYGGGIGHWFGCPAFTPDTSINVTDVFDTAFPAFMIAAAERSQSRGLSCQKLTYNNSTKKFSLDYHSKLKVQTTQVSEKFVPSSKGITILFKNLTVELLGALPTGNFEMPITLTHATADFLIFENCNSDFLISAGNAYIFARSHVDVWSLNMRCIVKTIRKKYGLNARQKGFCK